MQKGKTGGDAAFNQSTTSWVFKSSASLDNLFFFCRGVKNELHCVLKAPIKLDKFSELLLSQRDPNAKKSNLESTTVHLCTDVCVMVLYF